MSTPTNDPSATDSTVKVTSGGAVTRKSYSRGYRSDGTSTYRETWGGEEDLMNDFYEEQRFSANLDTIDLTVARGAGTAELEFLTDQDDEEPPQEQSSPEWSVDIIEIMRPLASHPYWARTYVPGAGYVIEEEIAKADLAIAQGTTYEPDANYGNYVSRYYALRLAGVVQYPAMGVEIKKTYTTTDETIINDAFKDIQFSVAFGDIAMPDLVKAGVGKIRQIIGYNTSDPHSITVAEESWEWIKRPTRLLLSGNSESTEVKLEETWWGVDRWSAVLYPRRPGLGSGGATYDPPQAAL